MKHEQSVVMAETGAAVLLYKLLEWLWYSLQSDKNMHMHLRIIQSFDTTLFYLRLPLIMLIYVSEWDKARGALHSELWKGSTPKEYLRAKQCTHICCSCSFRLTVYVTTKLDLSYFNPTLCWLTHDYIFILYRHRWQHIAVKKVVPEGIFSKG